MEICHSFHLKWQTAPPYSPAHETFGALTILLWDKIFSFSKSFLFPALFHPPTRALLPGSYWPLARLSSVLNLTSTDSSPGPFSGLPCLCTRVPLSQDCSPDGRRHRCYISERCGRPPGSTQFDGGSCPLSLLVILPTPYGACSFFCTLIGSLTFWLHQFCFSCICLFPAFLPDISTLEIRLLLCLELREPKCILTHRQVHEESITHSHLCADIRVCLVCRHTHTHTHIYIFVCDLSQ